MRNCLQLFPTTLFLLFWVEPVFSTTYYSDSGGGDPNSTAKWWTATNNTGTQPSDFTTAADVFVVQAGHSYTTTNAWNVSGTVQVDGNLTIQTANAIKILTITSGGICTGTAQTTITAAGSGGQFNINNGGKYIFNNATTSTSTTLFAGTETFGTTSTLEFQDFQVTDGAFAACYAACTGGFANNIVWNIQAGTTAFRWISAANASITLNNFTVSQTGAANGGSIAVYNNYNGTVTINGTLTLNGGKLYVCTNALSSGSITWDQTGDFTVATGTTFDYFPDGSGADVTVNFGGNFTVAGTGIYKSTNLDVYTVFNGGGSTQTYTNAYVTSNALADNFKTFVINSGAVVQLASNIYTQSGDQTPDNKFTVTGTLKFGTGSTDGTTNFFVNVSSASSNAGDQFILSAGGTLYVTSADGIKASSTLGNVLTSSSTARYSMSATGHYFYIGDAAQVTGDRVTAAANVTINNASGVTLTSNLATTGTVTLTSGTVAVGANTLTIGAVGTLVCNTNTITGAGGVTLTAGATAQTGHTQGFSTTAGTGSIQTTTRTYNATSNTFVYNGSSAQVTGNFAATVQNLTFNNSAGVTLTQSTTLDGTLTLTSGILTTTATEQLTLDVNSPKTISGSSTAYVAGPLKRNTNTNSSTEWEFPVGAGNSYYKIGILTTANTSTSSTDFTIEAFKREPTNYAGTKGAGVNHIANFLEWSISATGANTESQIKLYWTEGGFGVDEGNLGDLLVVHYTGGEWQSKGNNSTSTGSNYIIANASTGYSFHTFGSGNGNHPLPVSLLNFDAKPVVDKIEINWSTASEENNDYFTVERSTDGEVFEEVTKVSGAGNSNTLLFYTAIDNSPIKGTSYYRLKQTDFDGNYSYSDVDAVDLQGLHFINNFKVFPNPASNNSFNIKFFAQQNSEVEVIIYNNMGSSVFKKTVNAVKGDNLFEMDLQNRTSGLYFIEIRENGESLKSQVVKL